MATRTRAERFRTDLTQMNVHLDIGSAVTSATTGEPILHTRSREINLLLARKDLTITEARYTAGEPIAGPHIHNHHTDAFYVLEGELTFRIGREHKTITVSAGGLLAAPPGLAHSVGNTSDQPARWLTIHTPDGGFATFMRGIRDGIEVNWDIAPVPTDGGLLAHNATLSMSRNGIAPPSAG